MGSQVDIKTIAVNIRMEVPGNIVRKDMALHMVQI